MAAALIFFVVVDTFFTGFLLAKYGQLITQYDALVERVAALDHDLEVLSSRFNDIDLSAEILREHTS